MKSLMRLTLLIALVFTANSIFAQTLKFGHVDSQELLKSMPERAAAEATLQQEAKKLQDMLEESRVEYNKKLEKYVQSKDSLPALVLQTKEAELQELQQRIQTFQGNAQKSLQEKESQLLQPIVEKAQKAIKEVGKENGLVYVFDVNSLLYVSEQSVDVTPLVKTKLGIDPNAKATGTGAKTGPKK